ncbi:sigma 54-interacting transcriptional regulator [Pontibacter chinhatensis]|uniref:DNA-binding transcriptional response regulator, NtrC family, contains REC, AAA-type ATPase, and a Fis-type DNA-binding domains n=1 Tax=Pontibacter chinhatensis TaxID=1436961 RepID=A0A1I2QKA9_9BACT|nr:sigma-54 dependent transcriptional regulator [Pontibacter chinhatensis]SFG29035.1 DNA-binding transcriptional response regulator, NtrC family, contains REC, AAA-type ATPase, and a Fis-type DNA-binding domains [Pontibacter chinhatensis]
MSKLLVSWVAKNHDFIRNEKGGFKEVANHGPHYQFYQHFYNSRGYDKHILLYSSADQELWVEHLKSVVYQLNSKANIEIRFLELKNVISLEEIKPKVESLLVSLAENEIDIFFSPGTSIMQLSWFMCHQSLGLNTHLIQTSEGKFHADKKPKLEELSLESGYAPLAATIKQVHATRAKADSHFKLTPSIESVYKRAEQVAHTDRVTVLIRGESGTGKEHLARHIHNQSARRNAPFLAINCSALSDTLLESRLFGHKKGMFTGADKDSTGLFEQADGGTIFLDEIGDISPQMQQTLLRVLQEREIQPIGGDLKKINVRVVAATNAPLEQMCMEGRFRWDLYYRLAVAELELPSLCDRGLSEVKLYLEHFVKVKRAEFAKPKELKFTKEALAAVLNYTFPGNVRELENMVESLYVFCDEDVNYNDLPKRLRYPEAEHSLLLDDVEKAHVIRVYHLKNRNLTHTEQALGISKNTLKKKLRLYGVQKEETELEEG